MCDDFNNHLYKLYDYYRFDWIMVNGYDFNDLIAAITENGKRFEIVGFSGSIYETFDEFVENVVPQCDIVEDLIKKYFDNSNKMLELYDEYMNNIDGYEYEYI